ncbi:MAG: gliding motility lipoprotein GldH [Bacteroidales bacterium]|nr:gliding motility lipoprotein GldH [Bacteroidales bacterium]HPY83162.1 hypothetical protein [Bacteroidales bacterium]
MKTSTKIIFYPFFMIMMLVFTSCEPGTVYKKIKKLPENRMLRDTSFTFEFNNTNQAETYDIVLLFRYVHGFQFKQVVFDLEYFSENKNPIRFTFGIPIVGNDGKYIGEGMGDIWDIEHTILSKQRLPEGINTFVIQNKTHLDLNYIPNVMEVGLKIVQAK